MKTLMTLAGVAVAGTILMAARRRKSKALTFAAKALLFGGRMAALSIIGYRALRSGAETLSQTARAARKQSVKAWNAEPSLSIRLK